MEVLLSFIHPEQKRLIELPYTQKSRFHFFVSTRTVRLSIRGRWLTAFNTKSQRVLASVTFFLFTHTDC